MPVMPITLPDVRCDDPAKRASATRSTRTAAPTPTAFAMRKCTRIHRLWIAFATAALISAGGATHGDGPDPSSCYLDPCDLSACCAEPCACGRVWFGSAELVLARYFRTNGVRVGSGTGATFDERVEFDLNASPRVTLGVVAAGGLGFRAQWWEYSHVEDAFIPVTNNTPPDQRFLLDAYTVDFELFEEFQVHRNWAFELSGGVRATGFDETMMDNADVRNNSFYGVGPVVGIEGRRRLWNGQLYGRLQVATAFGDKNRSNQDDTPVELLDTVHSQLELAAGYRAQRPLGQFARLTWWAGIESMHWFAMSSSFNNDDGTIREDEFVGDADVGFGGFAFGLSIDR